MKKVFCLVLFFFCLTEGLLCSQREKSLFNPEMANSPIVQEIFSFIEKNKEKIIDEWIYLTEIPAPSGHEEKRAQYIKKEFEALSLDKVHTDSSGNVIGIWKGTNQGQKIIIVAHLDTVFQDLWDIKVERKGNLLKAPGIGDDTAGLINLLWTIRALKNAGFKPDNNYYFIATVGEELGMVGMRAFMDSTQEKFDLVIAIDGWLGEVLYGALGIHGRKIIFSGPGSHTMSSKNTPNPNLAVAKAVEQVYQIQVPSEPPEKWAIINVGMIQGGKVTNAVSQESFFTVDIRAVDQGELERIIKMVEKASEEVAAETGVQLKYEVFENSKAAQIPGAQDSFLVKTTTDILEFLGVEKIELSAQGTTDASMGLEKGILSICIGRTYGKYNHTLEEESEIDGLFVAMKQILLLIYCIK